MTGAASRFSARDQLESALEPSREISDQYQECELLLEDGELIVGRIEDECEGALSLRRLPVFGGGQELVMELQATEIAARRPHALSRMPVGLIDVLHEAEILDLLAYVLAGGRAVAGPFK